ncbi:MAG TPA: hypothetical protein VFE56_13785 [Candidatus Binataceae bacterium]|jgi:hypothetical protein|nr:hypothetical protein [Candidatus Binataceae bacterium]
MRVASGKIVDGKVVMDDAPFEDGASVTVIGSDDTEPFEISAEDEAILLARIARADRGNLVDGREFLARLGKRR